MVWPHTAPAVLVSSRRAQYPGHRSRSMNRSTFVSTLSASRGAVRSQGYQKEDVAEESK